MSEQKKELFIFKRDANGHLMCDRCEFKPKPTPKHPLGNPSTLHYHMKKHEGDYAHICKVCNHGFLHKLTLETHMAARHPEQNTGKQLEKFRCPVEGCDFESVTKANRRIHFLRKHCSDAVMKHMTEVSVENKKEIQCSCCSERFKSNTAFHYHIGKCLVDHNIQVHTLLASVC